MMRNRDLSGMCSALSAAMSTINSLFRFAAFSMVILVVFWPQYGIGDEDFADDIPQVFNPDRGQTSSWACGALLKKSTNTGITGTSQDIDPAVLAVFNQISASMIPLQADGQTMTAALNRFAADPTPTHRDRLVHALAGVMVSQVKTFLPFLNNPDEVVDIFQELYVIYSQAFQARAESDSDRAMTGSVSQGMALTAIYYTVLKVDPLISQYVLDNYISESQFKQILSHPLKKEMLAMLRDPDYSMPQGPLTENQTYQADIEFFVSVLEAQGEEPVSAEDLLFSDEGYLENIRDRDMVVETVLAEFEAHVRGIVADLKEQDPDYLRTRIIVLENYFLGEGQPTIALLSEMADVSDSRVQQLVNEYKRTFYNWLIRRYPYRHGYLWPSLYFSSSPRRRSVRGRSGGFVL